MKENKSRGNCRDGVAPSRLSWVSVTTLFLFLQGEQIAILFVFYWITYAEVVLCY